MWVVEAGDLREVFMSLGLLLYDFGMLTRWTEEAYLDLTLPYLLHCTLPYLTLILESDFRTVW